jgi:uridine kinase
MLIIGLTGGSGSGKTTLAEQIAAKFPKGMISLVPLDAYYKDHSHLTTDEKMRNNFDHPDSIDFDLIIENLQNLRMGVPVERPIYSYISCSREENTIPVDPCEIVLLDGMLTLAHEGLRQVLDLSIFLEVSEENRLERTIQRDIAERGRTRESVLERFTHTVKPMHDLYVEPTKHFAHEIMDGNSTNVVAKVVAVTKVIGDFLYQHNCRTVLND